MSVKRKIQIVCDLAMTVMLPLLMAYSMIGEVAHEWIGTGMFVLFILHHMLNRRFVRSAFKGTYTKDLILLTAVDVLLFADMLGLMVSGIILSRHVFAFLTISVGTATARILHLLCSYWGFVLMSFHIGIHWGQMLGMFRKAVGSTRKSKICVVFSRAVTLLISAFGLYQFLSRGLPDYMLLRNRFVFFDLAEPLTLFFVSYIAIMVLFAAIGYYIKK